MEILKDEFAAASLIERAEVLIEQNADVAKEPILLSKEGSEYAVHRFDWHDLFPSSGDIDILNQEDFVKAHFNEAPRTLAECQQAQNEIADVRHRLVTEALETYNQAAEAGHAPGALEYNPEDPNYVNDAQSALMELLMKGYLGGKAWNHRYQMSADRSNFPEDAQAKISDNIAASFVLGEQAEKLDVRMRDISADMTRREMDVTKHEP